MKNLRWAIINGDDFGFSDGVNKAIIQAHQQGILTSSSLMVTGDAYQQAVDLAQQNPLLGVGLHLVLCCGKSVLSPQEIPNLVDQKGFFSYNPALAGLNYQFNPQAQLELKTEIKAQLKKFQQTGLNLSHVDGHLHLHTHPVVLKILTDLAPEFKLKFIRLPFEELNLNLKIDSSQLILKTIYYLIFQQLRNYGKKLFLKTKIGYLDRVYGLLQTGKITESYLLKLIPLIKADLIEIYTHPNLDQSLENNNLGAEEFKTLCSEKCRNMLISNGFQLINYLQLAEILSK